MTFFIAIYRDFRISFSRSVTFCDPRLQNPHVFDYSEFKLGTIKKFLDEVYNVGYDPESKSKNFKWAELIELVKFLKSEGKNIVSGIELELNISRKNIIFVNSHVGFEEKYCENVIIGIRNKAFLENYSREEALLTMMLVFIIFQRFDNPDEQSLGEIIYEELYELVFTDRTEPYTFPQYKSVSKLEKKLMAWSVDLDDLEKNQLKRFYPILTEDFFPESTEFESRKVLVDSILGREVAEDDEDQALEEIELIVWRSGKNLIKKFSTKVIEAMDRVAEIRPARNNGWGDHWVRDDREPGWPAV